MDLIFIWFHNYRNIYDTYYWIYGETYIRWISALLYPITRIIWTFNTALLIWMCITGSLRGPIDAVLWLPIFLKLFLWEEDLKRTLGSSYDFDLWPHKKILKIVLSKNFEKSYNENCLRYSNEFFTEIFIQINFIIRKIFVENFWKIQKLRKN